MKQILIVEDDRLLNKTLSHNLSLEGFKTDSALNAAQAAGKLRTGQYDLVLLDVNLPDGSGYDLCRLLQPEHTGAVVIFLTANDQETDMIRGYEAGASDYITKPFSINALQHKIHAMFRMLESGGPSKSVYNDGRLTLDFSSQSASLNGKELAFSSLEYKMLQLFCRNSGQILTRTLLLEQLWDAEENYVDEHTLTTAVSRIRSKLHTDGSDYIKTVYGMGYLWTGGGRI